MPTCPSSVSVGALPASLSLNSSTGAVTGTPTIEGTASFTLHLADAGSQTANQALSIVVTPATIAITTASLPGGTDSNGYSQTAAATGGTLPYTWSVSVGALPAGLSLNTSTGAITGTPTTAGTASFTLHLADAGSQTANQSLSIVVSPATLGITTASLPGG